MGLIKRLHRDIPAQPATPSGDLYDLRDWPTITHPTPATEADYVWIGSGSALLRRVTNPNDTRIWHRYEGIAPIAATLPAGLTAGATVHLFLCANSSGDPALATGFFSLSSTGSTNRPAGYDWIKYVASFVLNGAALIPPFGTLLYNFASVKNATTPPGTVTWQAGNTAPSGYLKANGAIISRAVYADLFAAIGTIYGAGDGSTTFAIPDLRGEFIRGWDDGRGIDTGRANGSVQADATKLLMNGASFSSYPAGDSPYGVIAHKAGVEMIGTETSFWGSYVHRRSLSGAMDSRWGNALETRSRNVALLACIKF